MIRTKEGMINIEGDVSEIMADLSVISNSLLDTGKVTKEEIMMAVKRGFMSEEELKESFEEVLNENEVLKLQIAELFSKFSDELRGGKKDE